jgi:hypothetical protein
METKEELKELFGRFYKWHEGSAKVESNYRRIQRLFKGQVIDYKVTARLLSTILPNDEKWVLMMDRTNWKLGKSNVNLLVLGVAYKGMALLVKQKFSIQSSIWDWLQLITIFCSLLRSWFTFRVFFYLF